MASGSPRGAGRGSVLPAAGSAVRLLIRSLPVLLVVSVQILGAAPGDDRGVVHVGIIFDGPETTGGETILLQRRDLILETIVKETVALTRRDFDVRFPEEKMLGGEWTVESIRSVIDRQIADPAFDLIVSLGPLASNEILRLGAPPKPVVAAWALDIEAQGLPFVEGTSGVKNLSYLVARGSILRDLRKFREIMHLSTVHILVDETFLATIPEIPEVVIAAGSTLELELVTVPAGRSADQALASLPPDVEGVYVTPMLQMKASEFDRLVAGLNARGVPTFSFLGQEEVERGLLIGLRPKTEVSRLGRRVALNIHRILLGEDAGSLPVTLDQPEKLMINRRTARAIGIYPSWRVLIEAVSIDDDQRETERTLTFSEAVTEALEANLSLEVVEREVAAGFEEIREARSRLRPRLESSLTGLRIDRDRAEASFGAQPEKTLGGSLALTQLVYSDGARASVDVARRLHLSRVQRQEVDRLDIALEAAAAFLDVLRAETLDRVERDNLRLTESHLELARRRERIGASGPADVYRWESELATDRSAVLTAQNRVDAARVVLNRLLHRPLEEPFLAVAPTLADPDLVTGFGRLRPYVEDPASFAVFREFSVQEALSNSPELRSIDALIEAQERLVRSSRRSFWLPEVGLRGELERLFTRDLAGAGGGPAPLADRNNWSVALQATLPLFTGGGRHADLRRSHEELARLRLERDSLKEAIELRVRAGMFGAASSYTAIELSREASEAAGRNLELVTDAYSRGAVSVIEQLDAQNAALTADAFTANAVYDFLIDLMEIQRATNTFDFFRSHEGREAWFRRLEEYFTAAGMRSRSQQR